MKVRLEVTHSKANVKRVVLTRNTVIGRAPECNLRIAAGQISRKHCEILVGETGVLVRDLGSSNGTFVADQRLDPYEDFPVPPGSTLSVGGVRFVVKYELSDSNAAGGGSTVNVGRSKSNPSERSGSAHDVPQATLAIDRDEIPALVDESEPDGLPVFDDGFESQDSAAQEETFEGTIAELEGGPLAEAVQEMQSDDEAPFAVEPSNDDGMGSKPTEKAPKPPVADAPVADADVADADVADADVADADVADADVADSAASSDAQSEAEVEELTFDLAAEDSNVGNSGNLANFLNNLD